MTIPRGKDLASAILFWSCAALLWGGLVAIVVWFVVAPRVLL
jgi:hypothetical protein